MNKPTLGRLSHRRDTNRPWVDVARRSRNERKYRSQVVGPALARDLPWDILLLLYTNDSQRGLKVTAIQADVDAPMTTVLRWLQTLEDKSFITRQAHPSDRRTAYISLTSDALITLKQYFEVIDRDAKSLG